MTIPNRSLDYKRGVNKCHEEGVLIPREPTHLKKIVKNSYKTFYILVC